MHIDGPIPGQSLTHAPGSVPWEHPPKFTDVNSAMQFLLKQLQDEETVHSFLASIEAGAPLDITVYTVLSHGFAEGLWTPSLMILLVKPLSTLLAAMLRHAGIKALASYTPQKGKLDNVFATIATKQQQAKVQTPKIKELMMQAKNMQLPSSNSPAVVSANKGFMSPPNPQPQTQGATQ